MTAYTPLNIKAFETGLVQNREEFILPGDAFPYLQNAYVWRERIKRKQGATYLGRLQRNYSFPFGVTQANGTFGGFPKVTGGMEQTGNIVPGTALVTVAGGQTFIEPAIPNGTLSNGTGGTGTIQYNTGNFFVQTSPILVNQLVTLTAIYYPGLPVMGISQLESAITANKTTIFFDQTYAYIYSNGFQEFIPGTTWNSGSQSVINDTNFFWSTVYWQDNSLNGNPLMWVTNYSGRGADPIRYTNGFAWANFSPQVDAGGNLLQQCQGLLPFRGRLLVFNTLEGPTLLNCTNYRQRIRWAAIGTPVTINTTIATGINVNAWRSDIRGQGGFLDIPTTDAIVSAGFVRDNLVIYCENSTWQLRYTGRTIQPFQIERVNSELGSRNTFSSVQFDTSLVTIGNKAIVECDSFKSVPIDVKIPDFVFNLNSSTPNPFFEHGPNRIWGIRDFEERIAYWIYPSGNLNGVFPDSRLIYNYENDSWALFNDSYTALGTFQQQSSRSWQDPEGNGNFEEWSWSKSNFSWANQPALFPTIVAGNQQGYVMILDQIATNDKSLSIYNISGNAPLATIITSTNHNLQTGQVIEIINIPIGTPFATTLNNNVFSVVVSDANTFTLMTYNPISQAFDLPQQDASGQTYVGAGEIEVRDNFSITSKKFNFMDNGQNIQIGFIDILMDATEEGEICLNVYLNYNDNRPINTLTQNVLSGTESSPDTFFNSVIPTSAASLNAYQGSKVWQRVICPARANFITLEYAFNNAQMAGINTANTGDPVANDVQIDAQILYQRAAGRMTQF